MLSKTDLLAAPVFGAAANLLSASRFFLAALWLAVFVSAGRRPEMMAPIAIAGAASDFFDGRLARRMGSAGGFGQWLDALADIVFVLSAIGCEAYAGAIPFYIPMLIAVSFSQYAIDSLVLRGPHAPVKSRIGHWGGIINYAIVIVLSFTPDTQLFHDLANEAAPFIAIFYLAGMTERALGYHRRK